jgi:hypothetical protein
MVRPWARKTVNSITQAEPVLSDTLSNTAAIPQPTGETKMFSLNTFESNMTKIIAAATLAAFVLSLFA